MQLTGSPLSLVLGTGLLALPASAQSFTYLDFSSTAGLNPVGNAAQVGPVMRVTANLNDQTGGVWYDTPISVAGGFDTIFEFEFTDPFCGGADGMAFVIHNDPRGANALGEGGTSLGYTEYVATPTGTAIVNSLAIELDSWDSGAGVGDLSGNEISVHTMGTAANLHEESASIGSVDPLVQSGVDMSDGFVHTVRISYSPGTLNVYIDDLTVPVLTVPYSFTTGGTHLGGGAIGGLNLIGGSSAYVGFTATTGGCNENHDLLSWTWGGGSLGTNYCGPAPANTLGASGVISAFGSITSGDNDVTLNATGLPLNQFGIFITSQVQAFVPMPGGSQGNLCLGGNIGRYNGPGQVLNSGGSGSFNLLIDLTQTPTPSGPVTVFPGETWHYQAWYRDFIAGQGAVSNFTDGTSVSYQ